MPYDSISALPDAVKERYSPRCQEVFRTAFNRAMSDAGPGGALSEEKAFKIAHTAAGMCKDAGKSTLKAAELDPDEMQAWFAGKIPRRLLAIPFDGPLGGRDMDGEWFSERTDIKADWFSERPGLWHHGTDPTGKMGSTVIGKASGLVMDEDGWWVDFWLKAGEQRVNLVRRLVEKGADLFGSSGSIPHLVKRGKGGHIDVWPYIEQTLSTSPQNTLSTFRSAKAVLDDFQSADISVLPALRDVLIELDNLRDLPLTSGSGDGAAKAGRELSGANLAEIDDWYEAVSSFLARVEGLRSRVRAKYQPKQEDTKP